MFFLKKTLHTGAREICGYFDLANTYKILADDKEGDEFSGGWIAGGDYYYGTGCEPLADLCHEGFPNNPDFSSVGWLVLSYKIFCREATWNR